MASDDPLVTRVRTYFERYRPPQDGARILIALSGGPDSVALLTVLRHLATTSAWTIAAAHVNYGLRGEESDGDESYCRRLCEVWGIPLHVRQVAYASSDGPNLQAWARSVRYAFFDELVRSDGFDHVAIGHTLDDRAETVAAAVIEARGTFALSGIPPVRGHIIRPLFFTACVDVIGFLRAHGIPYRADSSNEQANYLRNRMRHEILPSWRRVNPSIDEGLARLGEQLGQQESYLFGEAGQILDGAIVRAERGRLVLSGEQLMRFDRALDPFILRLLIRRLGIDDVPTPSTVERFTHLRQIGLTGHVEQGELRIEWSKGQLVVSVGASATTPRAIKFEAGDSFDFGMRHFQSEIVESIPKPPYDDNVMALLDLDHLTRPFVMRGMQAGDRYEPYGLHGHKKVADILADRGVPAALRSDVPILADASGIVWPVGYPIAERAKVTAGTRRVLRLRVEHA